MHNRGRNTIDILLVIRIKTTCKNTHYVTITSSAKQFSNTTGGSEQYTRSQITHSVGEKITI